MYICVASNEHDSRGLKLLISKLGDINQEKYMQPKVTKFQKTCLTFIVEASKTVYRRKPIGTVP
ncbi:MAG: hypothetical protein ACMUEL_00220 [Flavobacteriales bacterium Tduv]